MHTCDLRLTHAHTDICVRASQAETCDEHLLDGGEGGECGMHNVYRSKETKELFNLASANTVAATRNSPHPAFPVHSLLTSLGPVNTPFS